MCAFPADIFLPSPLCLVRRRVSAMVCSPPLLAAMLLNILQFWWFTYGAGQVAGTGVRDDLI
jgi:hypothetical protein